MPEYELLLNNKENTYRDFHRYRLSAFYYLTVLVVVIFLVANFLSYNPGEVFTSSGSDFQPTKNMLEKKADEDLPQTTTQSPSAPYFYSSLPNCDLTKDSATPAHNAEQIILEFSRCAGMILMRFARNPEGLLFNWPYTIYVCDEEDSIMKLPLKSFDNGEKQYWGLLPRCQEDSTLVTLGISDKTKAEKDLETAVQNVTMFGTNPYLETSQTYDRFFHVALSNNDTTLQMNKTETDGFTLHNVTTIDQLEFFNETVAVKKIDMLWINPEAGNFEYWKYLNINGEFDKMGVKVCQINIEITKENWDQWARLITPLVKEKRYIFMRPMATQGGNVTRTFFLNIKDPECTRKYLQ